MGVDSCLDQDCCCSCYFLSSWHCSKGELGWLCSTVQNFGIVEQQKVEQNLPSHVGVGEPWVVGDQETGSMDFVVVLMHKVHRKA